MATASAPAASVALDDPARAGLAGFDLLAYDILANIGGKENVASVLHCITRVGSISRTSRWRTTPSWPTWTASSTW